MRTVARFLTAPGSRCRIEFGMRSHDAEALIGTSGWMYRHWRTFYPKGLPARRHLEFISRVFPTVEINASFYRLPTAATFAKWAEQTPEGFVFAVKASRYLTHLKRLTDPEPAVELLLDAARHLGPRLGPFLLQLPPQFAARPDRLAGTLRAFREVGGSFGITPEVAVEFRHASWFASRETMQILRGERAALVLADSTRWPSPDHDPLTARWTYLRFHGTERGIYGVSRLRPWAAKIRAWRAAGRRVFAYFNNDWEGYALRDACTLARHAAVPIGADALVKDARQA